MNIFKPLTLSWWQMGVFKIATVSFGVIIGSYFADFFGQLTMLLSVICIISGIYITHLWLDR